jgi:hypothetical protein
MSQIRPIAFKNQQTAKTSADQTHQGKNFSGVRASFLLGIYLILRRDRVSIKKRHLGKPL